MSGGASITRRLIASVLLLELLAALALIAVVANHERQVQFLAFEANLRATANALLGAVQEGGSRGGGIVLDPEHLSIPHRAVYRVRDSDGRTLGSQGDVPAVAALPGEMVKAKVRGRPYRFVVLEGERVIDPGQPDAIDHHVEVIYGLPEGRVWHAIVGAVRYFAIATLALLGLTGVVLTWLIRRSLRPIEDLAGEAEKIDPGRWSFEAPPGSKRFVELRVLASALEKTIGRLQQAFEQQRRFTSDAAHELKTDLAIVKSSAQLLLMRRRTPEEYEAGLAAEQNDIARMEATVRKMLTLARIEQGPGASSRARCDIRAVILGAVEELAPVARLRQVSIALHGLEQPVETAMAAEDARLLCLNVLMNAIQHAPPSSKVEIAAAIAGNLLAIRVRDHGAGISEQDGPHLFEPFYRADPSRNRESGGTGLGLAICRAICVRNGGEISIANHPHGGAVVEIRLRACPPQVTAG